MPRNDNPHATRLYDSIVKHAGQVAAEEIAQQRPLSKSADLDKKFLWTEAICAALENSFDENTVKQIRMDCACGPEMGKINNLKTLYQSCSGMAEFAEKVCKLNQGYTVECEDDTLFLIYPQCYCSCVKRINKPVSRTWCYCTLGYTKRMFEHILDHEVDVELIESVKTGGDVCRIKIVLQGRA
jgi:predicted hydrocarbon binding protein